MTPVVKRILDLIDKSDLNSTQILNELEISNPSTITDWRREKSKMPSVENVIKFANYFGVSTDYLLTGNKTDYFSKNDNNLSKDEQELLDGYRALSNDEQDELLEILNMKLRKSNKKIESAKSSYLTDTPLNNMIG